MPFDSIDAIQQEAEALRLPYGAGSVSSTKNVVIVTAPLPVIETIGLNLSTLCPFDKC